MDTCFTGRLIALCVFSSNCCRSRPLKCMAGRSGHLPASSFTNSLPFPVSEDYGERPYLTRVMDTKMDTCWWKRVMSAPR